MERLHRANGEANVRLGVMASLLAAAGIGACGSDLTGPGQLAARRSAWESRAPAAYAFTYRASCFCQESGVLYRVSVRDGSVVRVDQLDPDPAQRQVPAPHRGHPTVDSLFAWTARAYARSADRVDVTYDVTYHFPARISIDWYEDAVDDEISFAAQGLVPEPDE